MENILPRHAQLMTPDIWCMGNIHHGREAYFSVGRALSMCHSSGDCCATVSTWASFVFAHLLSVLHTRLGDRQAGFFCIYLLKTNHILICSDGVWVPSFCASPQTPSPGLSAPGLHLSGFPAAPHRSLPAHSRSLPDRTLPIGPPSSDPV